MKTNREVITTITVQGSAEADYDTALFKVTASASAETPALAKAKLRPTVKELEGIIAEMTERGLLDVKSRSVSMNTARDPSYDVHRAGAAGPQYRAAWGTRFEVANVEAVSEVYDKLSEVEQAEVEPPAYKVRDTKALVAKALRQARQELTRQFSEECVLFDKNPMHYEVVHWSVRRNEWHNDCFTVVGAAMATPAAAMLNDPAPAPMELMAGRAKVTVDLTATIGPTQDKNDDAARR